MQPPHRRKLESATTRRSIHGLAGKQPDPPSFFPDRVVKQVERVVSRVINQRNIHCKAITDNQVWFEFSDICQTPRSSGDYIQLAREFQTILVSNIPAMGDGQNDIVQRFIQLIDAVYDHNVKFIATALTSPDELYNGEGLTFPFQRTVSRLHEMRSEHYLSKAHIAD